MLIFDVIDYRNRLANNKMLMDLVAKEFIKESAGLVQQLIDYAAIEDWAKVAQVAHRIKGASAEVSGIAMSASAKIIEQAANKEDIMVIQEAVMQLRSNHIALQESLSSQAF